MAVASLVLGIVSVVFALLGPLAIYGGIAGIVGVVLGALGKKRLQEAGQPTGMATAGLVLSIIGTVLCLAIWIACAACIGSIGSMGALSSGL